MRAGRGIVQSAVIMQRAGHGTRGQRVMNGVGAEICRAVVRTCWIAGAIAAETAAAGGARKCRRPAAARMRDGRPAGGMPAASGEACPATVEAAPTATTEMCAAAVTTAAKVCAATVAAAATVPTSAMAATAMAATAAPGRKGGR